MNSPGKRFSCDKSEDYEASEPVPFIFNNSGEQKFTNPSLHPNNAISRIYLPIVRGFRAVGVCPMTVSKTNTGSVSFHFSLFSTVSLLSILVCTIISWIYIDLILNSRLSRFYAHANFSSYNFPEIDVSRCRSSLLPLLSQIIPLQLPINTSVNLFVSLLSISNFSKILETWCKFESDFQMKLNVRKSPYINLVASRNKLAIVYLVFAIAHCILISVAKSAKKCDMGTGESCWIMVAGILLIVPYVLYSFIEDFKFLFMFRTVEEGYRQVSEKIHEATENFNESEAGGTLSNFVSIWHELLLNLRQQTEMVSKCSSFHHIVSLSNTFIALVVGVYFSVAFQFTTAVDKEKKSMAYATVGFCFVGLFRCLIKADGSERIMNAEKCIARKLNAVKTGDDLKTQIQINSLIDLIGRDPAQITILNSFKLNTSFILHIIGQIATYLIIFLQFEKM